MTALALFATAAASYHHTLTPGHAFPNLPALSPPADPAQVRHDVNRDFYGFAVSPGAALEGGVPRPPEASPLYETLESVLQGRPGPRGPDYKIKEAAEELVASFSGADPFAVFAGPPSTASSRPSGGRGAPAPPDWSGAAGGGGGSMPEPGYNPFVEVAEQQQQKQQQHQQRRANQGGAGLSAGPSSSQSSRAPRTEKSSSDAQPPPPASSPGSFSISEGGDEDDDDDAEQFTV